MSTLSKLICKYPPPFLPIEKPTYELHILLVVDHFLVQFVLLPRNADLPVLTEDTLEDSDTSEIRHASPPQ